jgi:anti-anti-sigma regulatory factor
MELHVDHIGDLAVVECRGRIFGDDAASDLRDAVLSQAEFSSVILDLSQVYVVGNNILYMMARLHRWAIEHHVDLRFFNPTSFVCDTFEANGFTGEFSIDDSLQQVLSMLSRVNPPVTHAA